MGSYIKTIDTNSLTNLISSQTEWDTIGSWLDHEDVLESVKKQVLSTLCEANIMVPVGRTHPNPFQWACFKDAPKDILQQMINIGGQGMLQIKDSEFGRNGLQWALATRVSPEILEQMVSPELVRDKDKKGENSIHTACQFDIDHNIVELLIEKGGRDLLEMKNASESLPIHHACRYHSEIKVIKLMVDEPYGFPDTLGHIDGDKFSPLAYAFEGGGSKDLIDFLLDRLEKKNFHTLSHRTAKSMLFWTNQQPEEIKADLLRRPFVRNILNESFIHPLYLSIVFCDVYAQLTLVVIFAVGIDKSVIAGGEAMNRIMYGFLLGALSWRGIREFLQIATSPMNMYITDLWNWFDLVSLVLVSRSVIILNETKDFTTAAGTWNVDGAWVCITTGFVWTELILVLSHLRYQVLVFVSAVGEIIMNLVPFYLITLMIIVAFGNMFFVANMIEGRDDCPLEQDDEATCTRGQYYYTTLAMMLSSESDWEGNIEQVYTYPLTATLSMGFALIFGIVLLNILIVEIGIIYMRVYKFGRFEFWRRRLMLMTEIAQSFPFDFGSLKMPAWINRFRCKLEKKERFNLSSLSTWIYRDLDRICNRDEEEKKFFLWYKYAAYSEAPTLFSRLKVFMKRASFREILLPGESFERVLWPGKPNKIIPRFIICLCYPLILIICVTLCLPGFVFGGLCWAPSVKMYFFHGPINEPASNDQNAKHMMEKILQLETKLCDVQNKLENLDDVNKKLENLDDVNKKLENILQLLQPH